MDCLKHGEANSHNRDPLEPLMTRLPDNQGGAGRHKCPYCAYEEGYRQAIADAESAIAKLHN